MLKSFIKNTAGNFGIAGATAVLTLVGGVGLAVDYISMTDNVAQLQSAADGALLAAATSGETDEAKLEQIATEALDRLMEKGIKATAEFSYPENRMSIVARMSYRPKIMGALGFSNQTLSVTSAIPKVGVGVLDVAIVLDVTGSMEGTKLTQMKAAVDNFITEFEKSGADIRVSIIPFSQYVNVGTENANQPWIDNSEEGTTFPPVDYTTNSGQTCNGSFVPSTCTSTIDGVSTSWNCEKCNGEWIGGTSELITVAPERDWDGCVGSRGGNKPLQVFYGGTPFPAVYNDGYQGSPYSSANYSCPDKILPLTDDFTAIRSKVNALNAAGATYMPSGLAWGWRTLDDDVPLGRPISGPTRKKVLILMTDGFNTVSRLANDKYHDGRSGKDKNVTKEANQQTAKLCDNITSENILLYTIAYELPDGADADDTKILLSECSSTPEGFFNAAGGANLNEAFEAIGKDLAEIRLVN